jgi:25S rRNA (uracil2634-N3)-methyltransferase
VREFFCNARRLLRPYGEIHVSHKRGKWYEKWGLKHLAAEFSLVLVEKVSFQKADYPGYHQKKGAGPNCDKPFPLGTCSTFKFRIGSSKKQNGRRAGPISSIGGDTRPCRPLSLVQPWSGLQFVPRDYIVPVPMTAPSHVVDQRQPGMPLNFVGIYSHQGSTAPSLLSTPGSSLTNALGAPGRIPSMGRISSNCLLARLGQTLNENRIIAESLGNTDYFACEYQKSLLREYRMQSQLVPEATSLSYSAFLEARQWESVQRQERLRRRIAYGRSQWRIVSLRPNLVFPDMTTMCFVYIQVRPFCVANTATAAKGTLIQVAAWRCSPRQLTCFCYMELPWGDRTTLAVACSNLTFWEQYFVWGYCQIP